jgi:protein PsiE
MVEKTVLRNQLLSKLITLTEFIGLIIIFLATVFAAGQEVLLMLNHQNVGLGDLLLMFLYLEVLAMIAVYLSSGKLPIRFPIYIAIVALARFLILEMKELSEWQMLAVAVTIMLLMSSDIKVLNQTIKM